MAKQDLKAESPQPKAPKSTKAESRTYYDINGVGTSIEPQKSCAKLVVTVNGTEMHYIKMTSSEEIYHPVKNKMQKHMHAREFGRPIWEYKKVKKQVFDLYLAFLTTKNERFYTNTLRSLI